jgi:hypothetical protein
MLEAQQQKQSIFATSSEMRISLRYSIAWIFPSLLENEAKIEEEYAQP